MVGVAGFEPTTPCSQSRCANRTALHPETFKRHKGTHYISICNPISPRKPFGGGDTRGRSDPGGIQTHDLQNRNLTLYSAKLPSLIASLCPAKVHFSSQPLDIPPSKEGVALTTGKYTSSFLALHCFDGYSLSSKIISK